MPKHHPESWSMSPFPTWFVFVAKLPGISAESGWGPSAAAHPWENIDLVTSLPPEVGWDLCPVWRPSFRNLPPCIVSTMSFSVCACVEGACLPLFIKRSLLGIAYAAFSWSRWWKMLYKRGWVGLLSAKLSACQQFIAVWLQWQSKSPAASQHSSCGTALALPSFLKEIISLCLSHVDIWSRNWSYRMKSHGSLKIWGAGQMCCDASCTLAHLCADPSLSMCRQWCTQFMDLEGNLANSLLVESQRW